MQVVLKVTEGKMRGKEFSFDEHDTFLFGRSPDARCCLPDDPFVSRNHFLLEINPPECRLRDLGSLNGTYVNGVKYGGRTTEEPIDITARAPNIASSEILLNDGDVVKVGETVMEVSINMDITCVECGKEIPGDQIASSTWIGDTHICSNCRQIEIEKAKQKEKDRIEKIKPKVTPKPIPRVFCSNCGKDVTDEVGARGTGTVDYICKTCQIQAKEDPAALILKILLEAGIDGGRPEAKAPSFPNYEVIKKLGEGGMGAVYLGKNKKSGQLAALKVMISKVAADPKSVDRFQREAEVAAKLKHPNIVQFYEQGYAGGIFYFAMEYVEGTDVQNLIISYGGKIPCKEASQIICQTLNALEYAHNQGMVHRDLKPPNILLGGRQNNWTAKVSDFGLAKNFTQAGLSGMTVMGEVAGSMPFMPPEQVANYKFVKPASDIFAIGATLYIMILGQVIHDFPKNKDPLLVILQDPIIPVRKRDKNIPKDLAEVIERALEHKPENRFKTAGEMKKALEKTL
jgi:serine/threonine-protein kinase